MWLGTVGTPWSSSPSRSITTVMPCSSRYFQSSILGDRKRQPASSRQMMFMSEPPISSKPPIGESLLLRVPVDVEGVALLVAQVDPHALAGMAGLGALVLFERLEGDFRVF